MLATHPKSEFAPEKTNLFVRYGSSPRGAQAIILAAKIRKQWGLPYISAFEDLCHAQVEMEAKSQPETSNGCPLYAAPGVPILFDTDHFTPAGSLLYASIIRSKNQLPR